MQDSVALTYLCNRIFPDAVSLDLLKTSDTTARAEALVVQLEKAGLKRFISVNSITHVRAQSTRTLSSPSSSHASPGHI